MAVEQWRLAHPNRGRIEVLVGSSEELREYDPKFPLDGEKEGKEEERRKEKSAPTTPEREGTVVRDERAKWEGVNSSGPKAEVDRTAETVGRAEGEGVKSKETKAEGDEITKHLVELKEDSEKPGVRGKISKVLLGFLSSKSVLVRQDKQVIARLESLQNVKISLDKVSPEVKEGELGYELTISEPFLELQKNFTGDHLIEVIVKTRGELVKFDPPAGSPAAEREKAMEESPTKRWLYPFLSGLGKGGWAFAVLILGPIVSRIIGFLWGLVEPYFPDWELPSIPWPSIDLPDVHLPSIPWPHVNWPHIDLPDWHIPEWLRPVLHVIAVAADYSKIWVPIVIGIFIGLMSVRRSKKSQAVKKKWNGEAEVASGEEEVER
ncbi:hypothetical protein ACEN19_04675 [Corynebacterium auriscanis]|uniref:hypothetical protein n=1 Tax=Corynebacterium auriscanis TaxID=99807 RepID=UPI003CE67712